MPLFNPVVEYVADKKYDNVRLKDGSIERYKFTGTLVDGEK